MAYLARLDAEHYAGGGGLTAANPKKKLPLSKVLTPHFWIPGGKIPDFAVEEKHASQGYEIWRGLSPYDGKPIVCIATGFQSGSSNEKTGRMIQTYIIRSDMHPQEAIDTGGDVSICFNCDFRGHLIAATERQLKKQPQRGPYRRKERVCYVNIGKAVAQIWKTFEKGGYPKVERSAIATLFAGTSPLRIGSYGEPAAVPEWVWREALTYQHYWTGYTHAWLSPEFQGFRDFCMASVNSPDEQVYAEKVLGWRTYRVGGPDQLPIEGTELVCPYYPEAGLETRWTCDRCGRCKGAGFTGRSIVAPAHGPGTSAFIRSTEAYEGFETPDGTHYPKGYFEGYYGPRQELYANLERRRIAMRAAYPGRLKRMKKKRGLNPGHDHPRIHHPVARGAIRDQLYHMRQEAGLKGHPHIAWPHSLTKLHEDNARRYAQVFFAGGPSQLGGRGVPRYEFAEQTRWLPTPHRTGLLAHEVGHELAGTEGSEADADDAAYDALGVKIGYDHRWPGKGLQVSRSNPSPKPVEGYYFNRPVYAWWGTDPSERVKVQVLGPAWRGHLEYWNVIDPWSGEEITTNSLELFTATGLAWRTLPGGAGARRWP
jgi:hypothetical protein